MLEQTIKLIGSQNRIINLIIIDSTISPFLIMARVVGLTPLVRLFFRIFIVPYISHQRIRDAFSMISIDIILLLVFVCSFVCLHCFCF